MGKRSELTTALKESLKKQDKIATNTIRLIQAALKDRDIASVGDGRADGLTDDEILSMMQSMIKQRQESSKIYNEAGRDDLAEQEEKEIEVIRTFMPKQLSEEEVDEAVVKIIEETKAESIKDMGKIMGVLKTRYAGQVDMSKAGAVVKKKLA